MCVGEREWKKRAEKQSDTEISFLGRVEYQNFNYTFDCLCLHCVSIDRKRELARTEKRTHRIQKHAQTGINSFTLVRIKRGDSFFALVFQFFSLSFSSFTLCCSPLLCLPLLDRCCYSACVCSISAVWKKNKRPSEATFWFKLQCISIIE